MNMDMPSSPNNAYKGEAGHTAAWLCLVAETGTPSTLLLPHAFCVHARPYAKVLASDLFTYNRVAQISIKYTATLF